MLACRFDGQAEYFPEHRAEGRVLMVGVRCRLGDGYEEIALLDTGAEWSVLSSEAAIAVASHLEHVEPLVMSTRLGKVSGTLCRLPVTLVADEGSDIKLEASVLVSDDWTGPLVLGYRGFLANLRISIDPGSRDFHARFLFGLSS